MTANNKNPKVNEGTIIKLQYIAFWSALTLFIPSILLSLVVFQTMKYGLLVPFSLISYIAISSIINHISKVRPRGKMKYSTGNKAVVYGVIILIGALTNIIFIFTSLSDIFFGF
jgi:hypothetical protein